MTPFGRSGCCHANERLCLVTSVAWMEEIGEGAEERRAEEIIQ